MSELMRLIQSHLDRYGVTRATFAKRIGTTPQTVQNWKSRSTTMPKVEHLKGVAKETGVPLLVVIDAALMDAGYRTSLADDLDALKIRIARYVRDTERGVGQLEEFLSQPYFPSEAELKQLTPGMSTAALDEVIDSCIASTDRAKYGNDELFDREFLHQYLSDKISDLEEKGASDGMEGETESAASAKAGEDKEAAGSVGDDGQNWPSTWLAGPPDDPGVGRDEDGEKRHRL